MTNPVTPPAGGDYLLQIRLTYSPHAAADVNTATRRLFEASMRAHLPTGIPLLEHLERIADSYGSATIAAGPLAFTITARAPQDPGETPCSSVTT